MGNFVDSRESCESYRNKKRCLWIVLRSVSPKFLFFPFFKFSDLTERTSNAFRYEAWARKSEIPFASIYVYSNFWNRSIQHEISLRLENHANRIEVKVMPFDAKGLLKFSNFFPQCIYESLEFFGWIVYKLKKRNSLSSILIFPNFSKISPRMKDTFGCKTYLQNFLYFWIFPKFHYEWTMFLDAKRIYKISYISEFFENFSSNRNEQCLWMQSVFAKFFIIYFRIFPKFHFHHEWTFSDTKYN